MRTIDLGEWTKKGLGSEASAWFHNEDDGIMLKLYDQPGAKADVSGVAALSNAVFELGIRTPRALEVVEDTKGHQGVIFENVKDKKSLYRMIIQDESQAAYAGREFAKVLKNIHSIECPTDKFPSYNANVRRNLVGLTMYADWLSDEQREQLLAAINNFMDRLDAKFSDTKCLMGDAHRGNVIMADGEAWLIDLGGFSYGHPTVNLINAYMADHSTLVDMCIPPDEVISAEAKSNAWNAFIREYLGTEDEAVIKDFEENELKPWGALTELLIFIYILHDFDACMRMLA